MILKAYPKINIYLKIIDFDGNYHLLESRFARIKGKLYDEIEITESSNGKDIIEGDFGCDAKDSSVACALRLLREKYPKQFPPVHIKVSKHIPKGAGLGGGSSNAGCVLNGINSMFCLELSSEELNAMAKRIGADVAFFVSDVDFAEVGGVGEKITPHKIPSDDISEFEIYTPDIFCDTRAVYRQYRSMTEKQILKLSHKDMFADFSNQKVLDFGEVQGLAQDGQAMQRNSYACERFASLSALNDLFAPACALYPQLLEVAQELGEGWFFSGSGSSFFRALGIAKNATNSTKEANSTKADSSNVADFDKVQLDKTRLNETRLDETQSSKAQTQPKEAKDTDSQKIDSNQGSTQGFAQDLRQNFAKESKQDSNLSTKQESKKPLDSPSLFE